MVRDEEDDRLLPHQIRRPRLTMGRKHQATEKKALQTKGAKFRAVTKMVFFLKKNSRKFWHPPVCQKYKSETGCKNGRTRFFRHVEAVEKPSKKSMKGSVALLVKSFQLGCVSQDSDPRESILSEEGTLGSKTRLNFFRGTWHQKTNSGKEGSNARSYPKVCAS